MYARHENATRTGSLGGKKSIQRAIAIDSPLTARVLLGHICSHTRSVVLANSPARCFAAGNEPVPCTWGNGACRQLRAAPVRLVALVNGRMSGSCYVPPLEKGGAKLTAEGGNVSGGITACNDLAECINGWTIQLGERLVNIIGRSLAPAM
jgi:hypothetical protein